MLRASTSAMPRHLLAVGVLVAFIAPVEAFTSGGGPAHSRSHAHILFAEGRADGGGNLSGDAPSEDKSTSAGTITAELLMDDESLRAKEIAESFARGKTAATPVSNGASSASTAAPITSDDIGVAMVMDKARNNLDELKFQVGRVDEEQVRQLEKKEAKINRLKFSLVEVREQAEESVRKAVEAEDQIKALQTQVKDEKEESNGFIARIKEKFKKEKDELTTKVNDISEQLESNKAETSQELLHVQLAAKIREEELQKDISDFGSKLTSSESKVSELAKEAEEMRSRHRDQLGRQKKEAKRLQEASDRVAAQDKRSLRNKTWAAETALSAAKYDLVLAQKEIKRLKEEQVEMQNKMVEMQNEMKLAIASAVARLEQDKVQLKKDTINAMASSKTEKYEAVRAAGIKYDAFVAMNEKRVREAEEAAQKQVRFVRQEMNVRMNDHEKMLNRERIAMKEQMEVDSIKAKAEAFSEVKQMQETLGGVEDEIAREKAHVATLEQERKSFRKIIRMALKLARERTSNVASKITGRRKK